MEGRVSILNGESGGNSLPPTPTLRKGERDWLGWTALGALVLLFLAVSVQKIWAGDFWGQLFTGQLILERGTLPRADEYSWTAAGHPVTEVRWLYCVLIALGWKVGAWALCVGMAAALGAMWAVLVWPVRKMVPAMGFFLLTGMVAGLGRWVLRPELVTDVAIAVFLTGLECARKRGRVGWAWWLVGVQVLWVNMHSVSIFGPVLAWLFAGSAVVESVWKKERRRFAGWMIGLALAVTAACWVNPYFHKGAMYPLEMFREAGGVVGEVLGEMKSPLAIPLSAWGVDLFGAAVLAFLVVFSCVMNRRRMGLARLGVLVLALYLGATAQRNASLLAIMGAWVGLVNTAEMFATVPMNARRRLWQKLSQGTVAAASLLGAWYVASDAVWQGAGVGRETGIGVVEWDVPRGAAEFVASSGADTRVFNKMRDGHYLTWSSRGKIKVFIDGRTDVFGDAFLREYVSIGPGNWEAIAEKYKINTAVLTVRADENLIRALMKNKAWVLVYLDHRNVVFVRDRAEQAELVAAYRGDPSKAWKRPEVSEDFDGWKRALGASAQPWRTFGMAQAFLEIGSLDSAEAYLRKTLEISAGHERAIAELAAVTWFKGNAKEGESLQSKLGKMSKWLQYSHRALADLLLNAGRREEAIGAISRAVVAGASDPVLFVSMGDWHFEHKAWGAARTNYESAVEYGMDTAAEWKKLGYAREQLGDLKGAEEAYGRSLARDAKQHEVWYLMGLVQARTGNKSAARASLQRAIQINPGFGPAAKALDGLGR